VSEERFSKKNVKAIVLLMIFAFILYCFDIVMHAVRDIIFILTPFFLGLLTAIVVNIPMKWLERRLCFLQRTPFLRKIRRPVCLTLAFIFVVAIIAVFMIVITPELKGAVESLVAVIPETLRSVADWLAEQSDSIKKKFVLTKLPSQEEVKNYFENFIQYIVGGISDSPHILRSAVSSIADIFIGAVFAIYMLSSKERIKANFRAFCKAYFKPQTGFKVQKVFTKSTRIFSAFIAGQMLQSISSAVMTGILLWIFRIPHATLIAMIVFIMAFIPMFGPYISGAAGAILVFSANKSMVLLFLLLFIIVQQISGSVIYPKIMHNVLRLPSIWVLVAVTIGGGLMGIVGMLFFVPLFAIIYQLIEEDIALKNKKKTKAVQIG
jgi:predicted PurR-regulated permease PerM